MASKIADILEMLSDGRWHEFVEIRRMAKIDEVQLQQIADFLIEYTFILWDKAGKSVKLNKLAQEFLTQASTA